jgi:hypothetical protein
VSVIDDRPSTKQDAHQARDELITWLLTLSVDERLALNDAAAQAALALREAFGVASPSEATPPPSDTP